jgi:hypothetical protein
MEEKYMAYYDVNTKKAADHSSLTARDLNHETFERKITGEVFDYFVYPDGRKVLAREPDHNLIVANCSVLIACLMKGEPGYAGGTYWAVGAGSDTWSDVTPPAPLTSDSQLTAETYRKAILSTDIIFLDPLNVESLTPTNKIQITVTFFETEANGPLREFGIFGGLADGLANSGLMINHKIHPLIYKTNALQLERVLRLTF